MIEKAKELATKWHEQVNHIYDSLPYSHHLQMVEDVAKEYLHLTLFEAHESILAACWLHDVIEDCRKTYNDVQSKFGVEVAELVYALTNDKGRNRKERAGVKYYNGIKEVPWASFVKICDRIANFRHSVNDGSINMALLYAKETNDFKFHLFCNGYQPMFDELDQLCETTLHLQKTK